MAQPVLIISCPAEPLLLYANGRFCGELNTELTLPAGHNATVYLQGFPMRADALPIARRLDFQAGEMKIPAEPLDCMRITAWPGGLFDITLEAPPLAAGGFTLDATDWNGGMARLALRGGATALETESGFFHPLPSGAQKGSMAVQDGLLCVMGPCHAGMYMLLAAQGDTGPEVLLDVAGSEVSFSDDGQRVHVRERLNDLVGHGVMRTYAPGGAGEAWTEVSAQRAWTEGKPLWPQTPENAVRAFLEALALGFGDEALYYLADSLLLGDAMQTLGTVDGWTRLKYPVMADSPVNMGIVRRHKPGFEQVDAFHFEMVEQPDETSRFRIAGISRVWA